MSSLSHGYKLVTKDQAVLDHSKILKAILARDPAAAAKAMRETAKALSGRLGYGSMPK